MRHDSCFGSCLHFVAAVAVELFARAFAAAGDVLVVLVVLVVPAVPAVPAGGYGYGFVDVPQVVQLAAGAAVGCGGKRFACAVIVVGCGESYVACVEMDGPGAGIGGLAVEIDAVVRRVRRVRQGVAASAFAVVANLDYRR